MTTMTTALILVTVVLGLTIRYLLGFGFSMVFVPACSLLVPFSDAVILAVLYEVLIGAVMAVEYYGQLRLLSSVLLKLYAILGAYCGLYLTHYLSEHTILYVSMFSLLTAAVLLATWLRHYAVPHNHFTFGLAGLASGFLNSWSSMSGPPIVIYFYSSHGPQSDIKAALTGYFLVLYVTTLLLFLWDGHYVGFPYYLETLLGFAVILLFSFTAKHRLPAVNDRHLRVLVYTFIILVALTVLIRHAF